MCTGSINCRRALSAAKTKTLFSVASVFGKQKPVARGNGRSSDPNPTEKHQHVANNRLKCGAEKGRVHVPVSKPADEQEFNCHDHNGDRRSGSETWNQIWQGVTDSSGGGHQAANDSAQ